VLTPHHGINTELTKIGDTPKYRTYFIKLFGSKTKLLCGFYCYGFQCGGIKNFAQNKGNKGKNLCGIYLFISTIEVIVIPVTKLFLFSHNHNQKSNTFATIIPLP